MMFIVFFGTRTIVRDEQRAGGGPRQCQQCGQVALFATRRSRSYLHMFWIPLLPVGKGQPVLECSNCHFRMVDTMA